jgi:hypothetical protein
MYPDILHTGKKVRLQIRIDHKMFDMFTSVSTIILSGRTNSSQNVRQIWESTLSKSDYLVIVVVVGRESGYSKIVFTFLEVNMIDFE